MGSSQVAGVAARPFSGATELKELGEGRYRAELGSLWAVGTKAHGGLLLALMAKAGVARLAADVPGSAPEPLVVAADFLRAPDVGAVEIGTEVLKLGRTASVVAVRLVQGEKLMISATVTGGTLPDAEPLWAELPDMPVDPPADAADPAIGGAAFGVAKACELRFDTATFAFARGETAPPLLRGWIRPRDEPADVLFALMAGDALPPTVFNVSGRFGWAPTVQLTALMRGRPAPGWLRLESRTTVIGGGWFDEDVVVIDSAGRLVCQARQVALTPVRR